MKSGGDDLFPSEDEFEVCGILLELLELARRSPNPFFNVRWGAKRRRSAEDDCRSPSPAAAPPCSSGGGGGGGKSHGKVEASSPASPLCFSPSDTECKSRPSKRTVAKKKTIKELTEMVRALGAQQEQLNLEISKVIKYRDGLLGENLQLKSKQLKMKHQHSNSRVEEVCQPTATTAQPAEKHIRREDAAAHVRRREEAASYVRGPELRYRAVEVAYAGIPDLNCSAVEEPGVAAASAVGFEFYGYEVVASKAAAAAQARRRRLEIHRVKNSAVFKSSQQQQLLQQRLR
ncbi:hypothetical protein H6P81_018425 [Aristolochia fimbriata]|uniref:Uncharacterized protein n=1 Tax=Aristolochia fimbriata TaxID=158543 RepID=A0AAV7E403_ARIFI|nr:hypothetical protein H6P81_018425 [Aristolochia fimbriata]